MPIETMDTEKQRDQLDAEDMSSKPREGDNSEWMKKDDDMNHINKKCIECDCCKANSEDQTTQLPTASKRCIECKQNFCSQCLKDHNRQKLLKDHKIMDIPCQTEENAAELNQSEPKAMADNNEDSTKDTFPTTHSQHETNETEVMTQIKRERDRLNEYEEEMSIHVDHLLRGQENINTKADDITEMINKRHSECVARLDREKKSLLEQLESEKKKQLTDIEIKSNEALNYLQKIKDHKKVLDEFLNKESVEESGELTKNFLLIHVHNQRPIPSLANVSFHNSSSWIETGTLLGTLEGLNTEQMKTGPTLKNYLDFLRDVHGRTTDAMKIRWKVIILNDAERKNLFELENLQRVYEELDLIESRVCKKLKLEELQKMRVRLLSFLCAMTRPSSESSSDKQDRPINLREFQSIVVRLWNTMQFQVHYKNSEKGLIPKGFQNHGNTCYLNSVLQCLLQTGLLPFELTVNIYNLENVLAEKKEMFCLSKAFLKLASKYKEAYHRKEALETLYHKFQAATPRFNDQRQHDSHDLLIHFLDKLRVEERNAWEMSSTGSETKKMLTVVDRIFGGQFITAYTCHSCQEPYAIREPFLDISIPLCTLNPDEQKSRENKTKPTTPSEFELLNAPTSTTTVSHDALEASISESQQNPEDDHRSCMKTDLSSSSANDERRDVIRNMLQPIAVEVSAEPEEKSVLSRFLSKTPRTTISQCLQYFTRAEAINNEYLCRNCQTPDTSELKMTSATKRTLISSPPATLVLHLKRFEQKSSGFAKRDEMISYNELLDVGPFCSVSALRIDPEEENVWYSLYAVVVHSGYFLSQGHYVAYVKERDASAHIEDQQREKFLQKNSGDRDIIPSEDESAAMKNRTKTTKKRSKRPNTIPGQWFYISDETVRPSNVKDALDQKAFLLFYERIPGIGQVKTTSV